MAVNQLPSIPYRVHAPTPKATMKEMLKFIGMLGAPVVAPAVTDVRFRPIADKFRLHARRTFSKCNCVRVRVDFAEGVSRHDDAERTRQGRHRHPAQSLEHLPR